MPNAKIKIGFVFDDSLDSSDGVAQYVKTLGSWLSAQGHDVQYLVGETKMTSWSGGAVHSLAKNIKVAFNANKMSTPTPANKSQIKHILNSEKFDVLHVQVPYSPLLAARVIKNAPSSTAIVGTFHVYPAGALATLATRLLGLVSAKSLRRFDELVSVSSAAAKFAKKTYRIDTRVIPNLVDVAFYKKYAAKHQDKHVVFLGRLVERKGCAQLIKSFSLFHEKYPEATLSIAGDGPNRENLAQLVTQLGLQNSVKFLGFVSEEQKAKLLATAQIACFPSLYGESFGIVLIEAMAAGAGVVIGGENPGYRSVLGSKPKLLFDPKDAANLANLMEELVQDKTLLDDMHQWQSQEVLKYDTNTVGEQILALYSPLIAKHHGSEA